MERTLSIIFYGIGRSLFICLKFNNKGLFLCNNELNKYIGPANSPFMIKFIKKKPIFLPQ